MLVPIVTQEANWTSRQKYSTKSHKGLKEAPLCADS